MTEPQRRQVRVRRSPKVLVFLALGAVVGAVAAVVAVAVTPQDPSTPASQAVGFLIVVLAPVGALLGGVVALVLDGVAERRARTVDAERIAPAAEAGPPEAPADRQPEQQEPSDRA